MLPYDINSYQLVDKLDYPPRFDNRIVNSERKPWRLPPCHENVLGINRDDPYFHDQRLKHPPLELPQSTFTKIEHRNDKILRSYSDSIGSITEPELPKIEIEPGWCAPLRGTNETFDAVKRDFFVPTECYCCSTTIFCIQDADFILCSKCLVVSPISTENGGGSEPNGGTGGGVGLGFTMNHLASWQDVIRRERQNAIKQPGMQQKENCGLLFSKQEKVADVKRMAYYGSSTSCPYDHNAPTTNNYHLPDYY